MREKLYLLGQDQDSLRITPAYAGKTQLQPAPRHLLRDHPRMCGKNM